MKIENNELKVPLGKDSEGLLVNPLDAIKGTRYFCPGCDDELILRKGGQKRPHFSHKVSDSCSYETIIHKTAKRKVVEIVNRFSKTKENSPIIERQCPECRLVTKQTLPKTITNAQEERKLDSGFIADVVLLEEDDIVAAVEIKVTHAVTKEKEKKMGIPFIELSGESIVEYGMKWLPLLDRFDTFNCEHCENAITKHSDLIQQISDATDVPIPDHYYRCSYTGCWKCGKLILVFSWPYELHENKSVEAIKPRTIQYRYSRTAGEKYLANTCPFCKSLQGNFFLYSEPEGPFFGFNCGDNTEMAFKEDMKELAIKANQNHRRTMVI